MKKNPEFWKSRPNPEDFLKIWRIPNPDDRLGIKNFFFSLHFENCKEQKFFVRKNL